MSVKYDGWRLYEPCCGSSALSLHMLGATKSVVPFQGTKWRFRLALEGLIRRAGFVGPPSRVRLSDPGCWGIAAPTVLREPDRVADRLDLLGRMDPDHVYDALQGNEVPLDPIEFTAQFLFLQRLAFSGKEVRTAGGRWAAPGFNKTSAFGTPATSKFGEVKPQIPNLIRNVRALPRTYSTVEEASQQVLSKGIHGLMSLQDDLAPMVVYLDPPYDGVTGYRHELDRSVLLDVARIWANDPGVFVMVSESSPIDELTSEGWSSELIADPSNKEAPFRSKSAEWVTFKLPIPMS